MMPTRPVLIAALGDSQTAVDDYWVPAAQTWVPVLQGKLCARGCTVRTHVVATGGHTTAEMLERVRELGHQGIPDISIVYGGVNDASRKMPASQTEANLRGILKRLKCAARGADIPPRLVVVSPNYLNWPPENGVERGDCWNALTGEGTRAAQNVPVRDAAREAARAEGAAFCDLYAFQSALLYGPNATDTQGSARWHVAPGDQHHNAYGHEIVARAVSDTIAAQPGWLDALRQWQ